MLARAKINLTLEILGVRPDGYHDLRSLVVPISLADELAFEDADGVSLRVHSSLLGLSALLPPPEGNLAIRAVRLMQRVAGRRDGLAVDLVKRIPVGAGLGGGSADAAAVLNWLNGHWRVGLSRMELAALGAELGSDVPALTFGGTVLMEGRGERIAAEPPGPALQLVLAFPGVAVSTAAVYDGCIPQLTNGGQIVDNMRHALSGGDAAAVAAALQNGLTTAAEALHPEIAQARAALRTAGALGVAMSGSGSCVFGVVHNAEEAHAVVRRLTQMGVNACPVHTCPVM